MMRSLLILLLSLSSLSLLAQEYLVQIPVDPYRDVQFKGPGKSTVETTTSAYRSSLEEVFVATSDGEEPAFILFRKDKKVLVYSEYHDGFLMEENDSEDFTPLEAYFLGDRIVLLWVNKSGTDFYITSVDKAGSASDFTFSAGGKKEAYLTHLNVDNTLYVVTLEKRSSNLHFYQYNGEKILKETFISLDGLSFDEDPLHTLHWLLQSESSSSRSTRAREITTLDNGQINMPFESTSKLKMIVDKDKVYLTSDMRLSSTLVVRLDIESETYEAQIIPQHFGDFDPNVFMTFSNSVLMNDILFLGKVNKEGLAIKAQDIVNKEVKFDYFFSSDEENTWSNSPMIQIGTGTVYGPNKVLELDNFKKFCRWAANGDLAMMPYQYEDTTELTIALVEVLTTPVGSYPGGAGPPVSITYSTTRKVYFKKMLNTDDLSDIDGASTDRPYEKFWTFLSDNDHVKNPYVLFSHQGKTFYGYLDTKASEFRVGIF